MIQLPDVDKSVLVRYKEGLMTFYIHGKVSVLLYRLHVCTQHRSYSKITYKGKKFQDFTRISKCFKTQQGQEWLVACMHIVVQVHPLVSKLCQISLNSQGNHIFGLLLCCAHIL